MNSQYSQLYSQPYCIIVTSNAIYQMPVVLTKFCWFQNREFFIYETFMHVTCYVYKYVSVSKLLLTIWKLITTSNEVNMVINLRGVSVAKNFAGWKWITP